MEKLSRRKVLLGGGAAAASLPLIHSLLPSHRHPWHAGEASAATAPDGGPGQSGAMPAMGGHGGGVNGPTFRKGAAVDHRANGFNPTDVLRDFDWGKTRRINGRVYREWEVVAIDKEIEVAPGIKYPAWTFNGRVPGPTLRCRQDEKLRVRFVNGSDLHP